ncbi:6-phosphogluconolactonase [Undibacterium sp. Jales W-56]|uniref:6-phosphogluconolactonase n=1 Tax=Undibacterium sp. Jales W-56 TaxID=2897325 RepID=UPI0021CE0E70|nr:6-phosphogluconolactonase [Undibacterium sp. Jales W-56]MCU6435756.1 6-phosphogluconolactonase [Undibacterium sp. Jales W-56]
MLRADSIVLHSFANFAELSEALTAEWLDIIDTAAAARLPACFALAGGSTPAPIYRRLDQLLSDRDSSNVKLVATDERWVDDADAQSNEGLFKQSMAQSYGKQWKLISLKNAARTPEVATEAISHRLAEQIPQAFSAVLLGMGTDGHIASLFPNAPTRHDDLACLAALHPQTRQSRMSLSLPRLLNTDRIWLVISGAEKRRVLENAAAGHLPIAALLNEAHCDVDVFWCP